MNTRFALARVLVLVGSALALCAASWCATSAATLWQPHSPTDQSMHTVYAYRQWQSTGLYLKTGDQVTLTASGEWSYSPEVGLNGPEGALPAPDYYPFPAAPGGALLARLGETGNIFFVSRHFTFVAPDPGFLYLGINDDLLGDNVGKLTLKIEVQPAPADNK